MKKMISMVAMAVSGMVSGRVHSPEIGEAAPDFEAPSTSGMIRLSDYRDSKHVVLAFYFADFTPV